MESEWERLAKVASRRAENLYLTRQLRCSEAVVVALNHGLGGGLSDETAIRMASCFPDGLGGSGCLCGALGGGILALGLFLGRERPGARDKRRAGPAAKKLHDLFREAFGGTCCRVLSGKVRKNEKAHFQRCGDFTRAATEMTAKLILERRPELVEQADWGYLKEVESGLAPALKRVANLIRG